MSSISVDARDGVSPSGRTGFRDAGALLRRRWTYLCGSAIASSAIALLVLAASEDSFIARSGIVPTGSSGSSSDFAKLVGEPALRGVVGGERLAEDPEFVAGKTGLVAQIGGLFGLRDGQAEDSDRSTRAVTALTQRITIRRNPKTAGLDVELSTRDPYKAARLADAVAKALIVETKEGQTKAARRAGEEAVAQLPDLEARLQAATTALATARAQSRNEAMGRQSQDVFRDLADARARVAEEKARAETAQHVMQSGRFFELPPDAAKSPSLDKLLAQFADLSQQEAKAKLVYGNLHPNLIGLQEQLKALRKQVADEWKAFAESSARAYQAVRMQEAALEKRAEEATRQAKPSAANASHLQDLEAEAASAREAYDKAVTAKNSLPTVAAAEATDTWTVVPAKVPYLPTPQPRGLILILALVAGAIFGAAAALLRGLKNGPADDIAPVATTPPAADAFLGTVRGPAMEAASIGAHTTALRRADHGRRAHPRDPNFEHSIERLMQALMEQSAAMPAKVLLVSEKQGSGTTTIATSLAKAAARAGHRVLLIDADWRRPGLGDIVPTKAPSRRFGFLGSERTTYQIGPRLFVAPLMRSERTGRILAALDRRCFEAIERDFDLVLVDAGASAATAEIGRLGDAVDRVLCVDRHAIVEIGMPNEATPHFDMRRRAPERRPGPQRLGRPAALDEKRTAARR